jgi:hypothetical protein
LSAAKSGGVKRHIAVRRLIAMPDLDFATLDPGYELHPIALQRRSFAATGGCDALA